MKTILLILALFCGLLTGCDGKEEQAVVYSFCGENEFFSVSNGVIVLTDEEETIYFGNLEGKQGQLSKIVAYTKDFYVMSDGQQRFLSSSSVTDMTGGAISINSDLSRRSGKDIVGDAKEDLKDHLYFDLTTTDADGQKNAYQIHLEVTEVTGNAGSA